MTRLTGRVVCMDPGLRNLGISVMDNGRLILGQLVRSPVKSDRGLVAWLAMADEVERAVRAYVTEGYTFVSESMQIYRGRFAKADPDDLLELQGVVGAVAGRLRPPRALNFKPREWKKTLDPDVLLARAESRLSESELESLLPCPASLRHNMMDAVALGLWTAGRLHLSRI